MKAQIGEAIHNWRKMTPGHFESLALELCLWQQRHVPSYGAFAQGVQPQRWQDIPAVPVSLFREIRFCVGEPTRVFRTSGTTSGRRGEHALPDLELLDLASLLWFRELLPDCPTQPCISLVPDARRVPDSSLGHMIGQFCPQNQCFFDMVDGVDTQGAWAALHALDRPAFVAATGFALASLLQAPGEACLPEGSVLMVTGGFKGRVTQLREQDLLSEARARLGHAADFVGEYGMTELSSQLWDLGRGFEAPPWMKVYAVDPVSGDPLPEGQAGALRFVDLASWGSCLAIETEDLGVVQDNRVQLHGRLAQAPARGCSLSVEELKSWRPQ